MKKAIYIGGHVVYDGMYTKGKVYDVEECEHPESYKVISEQRWTYHPFKSLMQLIEDACGNCSSRCRREEGKCGLYAE